MEPNPAATVTKKLWNYVRIVLFMLRKGVSKRKLMMELHLMMKRGKIAGKAIGNLMFHHHHHHSNSICQSHDANLSFVAPTDYEFSCSNSPAFPLSSSSFFPFHVSKRKTSQNQSHSHHYFSCMHPTVTDDDITTVNAVQKVLEILNEHDITEASTPISSPFFGFGKSPMVRQLRITDSPFPLTNAEDNSHIDKAAEEFIQKFYNNLRLQNSMAEKKT